MPYRRRSSHNKRAEIPSRTYKIYSWDESPLRILTPFWIDKHFNLRKKRTSALAAFAWRLSFEDLEDIIYFDSLLFDVNFGNHLPLFGWVCQPLSVKMSPPTSFSFWRVTEPGKGEDWEHSWPDCKQRFPVLSTSHRVQTARSSQDYPVLYHVTRSSSDPLPHLFLVYDKLVVSSEERLRAGFHGRIFGRRCLCRQGVLSTQQMIHDVPSKHKREINSNKFKIRWKTVSLSNPAGSFETLFWLNIFSSFLSSFDGLALV